VYGILLLTPGYARDAASGRLVISVVPVRLVQGTLLCMYVASGIAKGISGDWLKYYDVVYTRMQGVFRRISRRGAFARCRCGTGR
jgi:hypothetical protein